MPNVCAKMQRMKLFQISDDFNWFTTNKMQSPEYFTSVNFADKQDSAVDSLYQSMCPCCQITRRLDTKHMSFHSMPSS